MDSALLEAQLNTLKHIYNVHILINIHATKSLNLSHK